MKIQRYKMLQIRGIFLFIIFLNTDSTNVYNYFPCLHFFIVFLLIGNFIFEILTLQNKFMPITPFSPTMQSSSLFNQLYKSSLHVIVSINNNLLNLYAIKHVKNELIV